VKGMEKALFIVTHSEDDAERATLPFVMAVTALASDMQATIVLQMAGVWLAKEGHAKIVHESPFPPVIELMEQFKEAGGRLLVCQPCLKKRQIEPGELVEGAVIVNAPTIIKEAGEAKSVMVY
jgi:predicted peroxiredoxin